MSVIGGLRSMMSRVLVFAWDSKLAATLATDLSAAGRHSWSTSSPLMAADLVRQHQQISCAVMQCAQGSPGVCQELQSRRPDLRIVGIQEQGQHACLVGCQISEHADVERLLPAIDGALSRA